MIRRQNLLANLQGSPVQRFGRCIIAEYPPYERETSERSGNFVMLLSPGTLDLEQTLEERLGTGMRRLADMQPAQFVEGDDELRMILPEMSFANGKRFDEEPLGLRRLDELLLECGEADEGIDVLPMERGIAARRVDCSAQCCDGCRTVTPSQRQPSGLDPPLVQSLNISHVTYRQAVHRPVSRGPGHAI